MAFFFPWKLFLDDERNPVRPDEFLVARSYEDAIQLCEMLGCPEFVTFDHDLGNGKTGKDFAEWLTDQDVIQYGKFFPENFSFEIHSQNPIGAANIEGWLKGYFQFRKDFPYNPKL